MLKKTAFCAFAFLLLTLGCAAAFAQGALDVYLLKNKNKDPLPVNNFSEVSALLKEQGKDKYYALTVLKYPLSYEAVFFLYPSKWTQYKKEGNLSFVTEPQGPSLFIDIIDEKKDSFLNQMSASAVLSGREGALIDSKAAEVYRYKLNKDGFADSYIFPFGGHLFAVTSIYGAAQKEQSETMIKNIIKSFGLAKIDPKDVNGTIIENVSVTAPDLRGERVIKFETGDRVFYAVCPKEFSVRAENKHIYLDTADMPKDSALIYIEKMGNMVSRDDYEEGVANLISAKKGGAKQSSVRLGRLNIKTSALTGADKNADNFYFNNGGNFVLTVIAAPKDEQRILPSVKKFLESVRLLEVS